MRERDARLSKQHPAETSTVEDKDRLVHLDFRLTISGDVEACTSLFVSINVMSQCLENTFEISPISLSFADA